MPPLETEIRIAELASRQHGVVTRQQLIVAGMSVNTVDYRVKVKRLHRLHRGVYQVGPVAAPLAREMAAVLACGPSAVVSHRSAAVLWKLLPAIHSRRGNSPKVDIIVTRGNRQRSDIGIRRVRGVGQSDVTTLKGIPITTPARTIFDLAESSRSGRLEQAFAQALERNLTTPDEMRALVEQNRGASGTRRLRAMLEKGAPALTRSEAERRFLSLLRKAQLSAPATNQTIEGFEVDFLWEDEGLVVEIDGFAYHSSRRAFERDRHRDAVLAAAGMRVVRITWRKLVKEPEAVLVRLARALALVAG